MTIFIHLDSRGEKFESSNSISVTKNQERSSLMTMNHKVTKSVLNIHIKVSVIINVSSVKLSTEIKKCTSGLKIKQQAMVYKIDDNWLYYTFC